MLIALNSLNKCSKQQQNNLHLLYYCYIHYLISNILLNRTVLSLTVKRPQAFVIYGLLQTQQYTTRYVSSSACEGLPYNIKFTNLSNVTLKIGSPIVITSTLLFLKANIIF